MPRHSIPEVFLALSPRQTASALGVHYNRVAEAIADGALVVRCSGSKRRISTAEIAKWFETWPVAPSKRKSK